MPELIAYVQGPMIRKEVGIFGIGAKQVTYYQMSPQLYLDNQENPTKNFGTFNIDFDQQPTKEDLEARIKRDIESILGNGVWSGDIIIPTDKISINIKYED